MPWTFVSRVCAITVDTFLESLCHSRVVSLGTRLCTSETILMLDAPTAVETFLQSLGATAGKALDASSMVLINWW